VPLKYQILDFGAGQSGQLSQSSPGMSMKTEDTISFYFFFMRIPVLMFSLLLFASFSNPYCADGRAYCDDRRDEKDASAYFL
jgi:hypothetical protein